TSRTRSAHCSRRPSATRRRRRRSPARTCWSCSSRLQLRSGCAMPRTYVPYREKHKWPKGFGSLCPSKMPETLPQEFLERAVHVEGVGENKLWFASGEWCFCAHPSPQIGVDVWHGFPVIGCEVDERVLRRLLEEGMMTPRERRRLRKQ